MGLGAVEYCCHPAEMKYASINDKTRVKNLTLQTSDESENGEMIM